MIYRAIAVILACGPLASAWSGPVITRGAVRTHMMSTRDSDNNQSDNPLSKLARGWAAAALAGALVTGSAPAFAEAPVQASAPPVLAPQIVTRQSIKAGTPEKWIYSKFLDEVEKNDVEKVTFSPDGKKAVGVNTDGDRFIVDIPNDPNLLSFLVQHKVEINVAPINANGGVGADAAAALVIPEGAVDRLLQVNIIRSEAPNPDAQL
jgi:hypothetical protein